MGTTPHAPSWKALPMSPKSVAVTALIALVVVVAYEQHKAGVGPLARKA